MTPTRFLILFTLGTLLLGLLSCTGSNDPIFFSWGTATQVDAEDDGSVTDVVAVVDSLGNVTAVWVQASGTRLDLWSNRFVPSRGWDTAERIELENGGNVEAPLLVIDPDGDVTAVWRQSDGTRVDLWSNRFTYPVGWGTAERIDSEDLGNVRSREIVIDAEGNIIATWRQFDGTFDNTWVNRYDVDSQTWGTAQKLDTEDLGDTRDPVIVGDHDGDAVVVWAQSDGTRDNQWSSRYSTLSGWSVATKIENEDLGDVQTARLVQESVHTTAVWVQSDGVRLNLWANRYLVGTGWGVAQKIETEDLGDVDTPELVVDRTDDVTVIWRQHDGTGDNLWANRHSNGSWSVANLIESDTGTVAEYRLYVDDDDRVMAIWTQSDGTRNDLRANRFVEDLGWGSDETIDDEDLGDALLVAAAVFDASGAMTIVWQQEDGTVRNQWANRFEPNSGWETAEKIETEDLGDTRRAQLVIDNARNVLAVWRQDDSVRFDQWANRYTHRIGWGTAEKIDRLDGDVQPRTMVIDANGRVTVLWPQFDGTRDDLWANRYQ